MTKRLAYLDGLKGWMAVLIVLAHYMLALWPKGYVGFGSGAEGDLSEYVTDALPWSLFSNTSISLYLLFGMISFLVVVAYRNAGAGSACPVLERQASKRYFQFLIPVFVATVGAYILYETGILRYEELAELSGSVWNRSVIPTTDNVWLMLFYAVIGIYFNNSVEFLTVLWCMHIIFIGSYLVYAIWALFGNCRWRFVSVLVFSVICIFFPEYFVFAAGALSGELFYMWQQKSRDRVQDGWKNFLCGVILIVAGIVSGLIPSPLLPEPFSLNVTYAVSVFAILTGLMFCKGIQRFLSWRGFVWLGKYLFSIILVHIFVLYTFSAWFYHVLSAWLEAGSGVIFIVTSLVSFPVVVIISIGFYRLFELPSRKLAAYAGKRIQGK